MNLKRLFELMVTDMNSPRGLVIRAEKLEEDAEKLDGEMRSKLLLYARLLRELSLKGFTPDQNEAFIQENMRAGTRRVMPNRYMRIVQIIVGLVTFWWSWNYISRLIEEAGKMV